MCNKSIILILLLFLHSCFGTKFEKDECVQEVDKKFTDTTKKTRGQIYKITKVMRGTFRIAAWHNLNWLDVGTKKLSYFKETNRFRYVKIQCPDFKEDESKTGGYQRLIKSFKLFSPQ